MRRSFDERFRGFPAVLGISVAMSEFVEVVDAIFWTGHLKHRYHYESTRKLIYYTHHTSINKWYHPWPCFMVAISCSWCNGEKDGLNPLEKVFIFRREREN